MTNDTSSPSHLQDLFKRSRKTFTPEEACELKQLLIGKNDFPYHFKKINFRFKMIGYNIYVSRQTACLVVNPIKVNNFAYLFNCTMVGRASD